jgi:hypothetical protein
LALHKRSPVPKVADPRNWIGKIVALAPNAEEGLGRSLCYFLFSSGCPACVAQFGHYFLS